MYDIIAAFFSGLKLTANIYDDTVPVIYATEDTLQLYLEGSFEEYPLWIRDVVKKPDTGSRDWVFWQYTNRKRLDGYEGDEMFIDVNVFGGDRDDWESWLTQESVSTAAELDTKE